MDTLPPTEAHGTAMRQDISACAHQALPWCGIQSNRSDSDPDPIRVQRAAFERFSVSTDGLNIGLSWTSHARSIDRQWSGRCGDMTFTVLEMLDTQGFPRDHMWRALVIDGKDAVANHMIGIIQIKEGFWIVGDTDGFGQDVYRLKDMRYKIAYLSRVSDGPLWHKVKP